MSVNVRITYQGQKKTQQVTLLTQIFGMLSVN
jgi:hypothetical protein